ncbi:hypothetical protein SNE40_019767 [Patella caerulea]|uniref:Actin-related protein 2/3 complex subunit n=1 Tax=Patella caerulea TaxID=87958 RepID=A0AAN8J716_PATCE
MAEKHNFGIQPVTCHTWNKDRTGLALSLNSSEVQLYKKNANKWQPTHTLTEHGQRVTSIDWAANSNKIVTCGADRNAYVWTMNEDGSWKPNLVILRINRAATFVKWSPNERKFAVGSGARLISVSYYEDENNWWVSKHIKKPIRSTVTCIDWHPNSVLLAAGSTDFKARVFSGYIKEYDTKPDASSWGTKMTFGTLLAEHSNGSGGWVHSVSFSPSGDRLVWVGHDSSVNVVDAAKESLLATVKGTFLPFKSVTWVTENSIVASGYDCNPMLFTYDNGGKLNLIKKLDEAQKKESGTMRQDSYNSISSFDLDNENNSDENEEEYSVFSAMNRFKSLDSHATAGDSTSELKTQHQNTITQVCIFSGTKSNCSKFSTSGVDGNIIIWDVKSLEKSIAGLKIA